MKKVHHADQWTLVVDQQRCGTKYMDFIVLNPVPMCRYINKETLFSIKCKGCKTCTIYTIYTTTLDNIDGLWWWL